MPTFTDREKEVVDLIIKGHRASEIAKILEISVRTAEGHNKMILLKSGCKTWAQFGYEYCDSLKV